MGVDAEEQGASSTSDDDPRITRIGKFLRKYKLDELPQLINVLKGNMGLGGPRPEDPRYAAQYTPEQKRILSVRPGITSAASLAFRKEEQMLIGPDWERIYCAEVLPAKLTMDLAYFSRRTLFSDIFLIIRTILSIFH
jgi:lipopolysaccharide/colanic/teichoic acid biosynthesis glycosyltransferase